MKVRNRSLFVLAMIALCGVVYYMVDRLTFLHSAQRVDSVVGYVHGVNAYCRRHRPCTKFSAVLEFTVAGRNYALHEDAGRKRGHDRPIEEARHRVGERVRVVYHPKYPYESYRDTFWDLWDVPIMVFILHVALLIGSFNERYTSGDEIVTLDLADTSQRRR